MEVAAAPAAPAPAAPAVASPPRFVGIHTLCMRLDDVRDLPASGTVYRMTDGVLGDAPLNTSNTPPERLAAAIAKGELYVLWASQCERFEELTPHWALPKRKAVRAHHDRRYRVGEKRATTHDTDAD